MVNYFGYIGKYTPINWQNKIIIVKKHSTGLLWL